MSQFFGARIRLLSILDQLGSQLSEKLHAKKGGQEADRVVERDANVQYDFLAELNLSFVFRVGWEWWEKFQIFRRKPFNTK